MADKNTEIDSLYESMHQKDMAAIERKIAAAYRKAAEEASKLADIQIPGTSKAFSIDDYPQLKKKVSEILEDLHNRLQTIIVNGVESQWTLANNKNNELSRTVFGDNIGNLSEQQYSRYFSNNSNALQSFIMRTEAGLNLSQRVWKYTGAFKTEIEAALSIGIGTGKPAAEIAREVKSYLQNPDKLFRRVRDEKGNLKLSKAARNYHPGQGVYRSSYMNARRLAVTETNIAYRTSDYMRWQQLDFVVGIRICLSNNHNCRGVPAGTFRDICDQLSAPNKSSNTSERGCYPKDFKFTGWHPHCRCHAITILKTDEEIAEDNRRILAGEPLDGKSVNRVDDVPGGFKQWLKDNEERAKRSYSVPYFIKDNPKYIPKGFSKLYAMRMPYDTYAEYEAAMKYNKKHAGFSTSIAQNNRELSAVLPVLQGKIMNFTEADGSKCNPNYSLADAKDLGYHHNCQTCTMTYELRRRGFDVEAKPNPVLKGYSKYRAMNRFYAINNCEWTDRFLTADGKSVEYELSIGIKDTGFAKLKFIEDKTAAQGRYEVYCAWKKGDAHVFIVERQKDGNLLWFDPQSGRRGGAMDFYDDINEMKHNLIGILRIDDKLINPLFASRVQRK